MITGIAIENFKGVGERVELELAPITLLFGANSAGKSTVLHALHYAAEIVCDHNLDAVRTRKGGDFVDLGGFRQMVHGHDLDRSIRLAFSLDMQELLEGDPPFDPRTLLADENLSIDENLSEFFDEEFLEARKANSCQVELEIAWSGFFHKPYVREYKVVLDGRVLGTITCDLGRTAEVRLDIDVAHPTLIPIDDDTSPSHLHELLDTRYEAQRLESNEVSVIFSEPLPAGPWDDALPDFDCPLRFARQGVDKESLKSLAEKHVTEENFVLGLLCKVDADLSNLLLWPGQVLRERLQNLCYLGPIRDVPVRKFEPAKHVDPARCASGQAAWDILHLADDAFLERVNQWLERMDIEYRFRKHRFVTIDRESDLMARLTSGDNFDPEERLNANEIAALPTGEQLILERYLNDAPVCEVELCDVGVGMSQLLPFVIHLLHEKEDASIVVEQPELHVHPKLQAAVGDLIISRAVEHDFSGDPILLETHSEHLILRLLRRIREHQKTNQEEASAKRQGRPESVDHEELWDYFVGEAMYWAMVDADGPLRAKKIAQKILEEFGIKVTRTYVNQKLYSDPKRYGCNQNFEWVYLPEPEIDAGECRSEAHYALETLADQPEEGLNQKQDVFTPDQLAVQFVSNEEGETRIAKIEVDDEGEFIHPWPDDFFEIDFQERFS